MHYYANGNIDWLISSPSCYPGSGAQKKKKGKERRKKTFSLGYIHLLSSDPGYRLEKTKDFAVLLIICGNARLQKQYVKTFIASLDTPLINNIEVKAGSNMS